MATKIKSGQIATTTKRANVTSAYGNYFGGSNRYSFRDGVDTDKLVVHFTVPENYISGDVLLKITFRADGALSATTMVANRQLSYWAIGSGGESSVIASGNESITINASAAASLYTVTIPAASVASGKQYWFAMTRLGTNGSDNCTVEVSFLGAYLEYTGTI